MADNALGRDSKTKRETTYLEFFDPWDVVALAVEIIWVECLDGLQHLVVLLVHEVPVCTSRVERVEGVVSDHGESFVG